MMAYSVARRTQEIGIRLAIGATRSDISRMVLRDALTLVVVVSAAGLAIALLLTRPLAMSLAADLSPADSLSLGAVVVVLAITALVASWGGCAAPLALIPQRCCDTSESERTQCAPTLSYVARTFRSAL